MLSAAHDPEDPAGRRNYVLSGLLRCGLHEESKRRRMQGYWATMVIPHDRRQYASEYAVANQIDHQGRLREGVGDRLLDEWLGRTVRSASTSTPL